MEKLTRKDFSAVVGLAGSAALLAGCNAPRKDTDISANVPGPTASTGEPGIGPGADKIVKARGLTPDEVNAALRTFVPPGKHDDFVMFASGGHSGQVVVLGVPSMRTLKVIPVFTPDSYIGYGYDVESNNHLRDGAIDGHTVYHGDTHHPALSETAGDYDGKYLFINDKNNARVAVIDLTRFDTKQIVKNPHMINDHGHCVTPNTEYVIETSQYAAPIGWGYVPLTQDNYTKHYRGIATYWHFDRERGRIDPSRSFSIELPPFFQDITDSGKLASDGWSFTNSYNSELAIPELWHGGLPPEASMSRNAFDWLHVIHWRGAEALVRAGHVQQRNGMALISLDQAVANDLIFLIAEGKSPHGCDVTPDGRYIAVGGKLDPDVQIYSFARIQEAIKQRNFKKGPYGIPVLPRERTQIAGVKVGLGPLHTVYDDQGYGYTSLFLDSACAKWKIGDPDGRGWEMVDKVSTQYNPGHLAATHGDTVKPRGKYVVSLNKWSLDRFTPTGPLYPRNLQLIDVASPKIGVIFDGAMGIAEPHYAQIIEASLLKPASNYPQGFNTYMSAVDPDAPKPGSEGVRVDGNTVHVAMTQSRSHFMPDVVNAKSGQRIVWRLTNTESTANAMHGFALAYYNKTATVEPGETTSFDFVADKAGVYPFYCTDFCSALHLEMMGYLIVS
jgi:nitrous-oxide reductase